MLIYSSYYDNVPNLSKDDYTFVRVSRKEPPEWFLNSYDYVDMSSAFGPTELMLKDCHPLENWEVFEPRYKKEILAVLNKEDTVNELEKIYTKHGNKPLLLLCYETSQQNCHRHLIADFLNIKIEEI